MDTNLQEIEIGRLYQELLDEGRQEFIYGKYKLIDCSDLTIKTFGNKLVPLKFISKHTTTKDIIKITIESVIGINAIQVTTDHTCMIYNKQRFFDNLKADDVHIGNYVSVRDERTGVQYIGTVVNIENTGKTTDYVYDFEVDDDLHCFYANNVLIHNSLFINIKCITDVFKKKYSLAEKMKAWPDDVKFELWHFVEDFVINDIGNNIQSLLKTECHCEDTSMLGYELEYIGDVGIYQAKKNYGVHKIIAAGPKLVDSAKFVGLEMRKATMPAAIKEILSVVYDNTFEQNWTEEDFRNYIFEMFDKFKMLSVNDVAQWKGYSTAKASVGFLKAEKGATGIAKACQYYNDLIKNLGISKKHEEIRLNEKVRFVYLIPDNQYGINCIAFNDHDWPKEFNSLFQVDYSKMFDKCVLSPLKNFMLAAKYKAINPNTQVLFDITDI